MLQTYLLFVAEEVRRLLASLGLRSLDEAIGRVECLRQRHTGDPATDTLDLSPLLARAGELLAPHGRSAAWRRRPAPPAAGSGGARGGRARRAATS